MVIVLELHRFQILPILQAPRTAIRCIHKYKYQYRYMETLECVVIINFFIIILAWQPISWLIMHKQQNWYLYNVLERFRYHQNMLVLA